MVDRSVLILFLHGCGRGGGAVVCALLATAGASLVSRRAEHIIRRQILTVLQNTHGATAPTSDVRHTKYIPRLLLNKHKRGDVPCFLHEKSALTA